MQVQVQLESEMNETGIQYPRVANHIKKSGFSTDSGSHTNLNEITNQQICDTILSAKAEAISALKDLGIFVKDKDGKWEELTLKVARSNDDDDDDDGDGNGDGDDDEEEEEKGGLNGNDNGSRKDVDQEPDFISNEELLEDVSVLEKQVLLNISFLKVS